MILPRYWDRLTATLHAVDLHRSPEEAWRFLVYQGFAEDSAEGLRFFEDVVRQSREMDHPTGSSPVGFIATELMQERLVEPRHPRDPDGRSSNRAFRLWKRRALAA
ncbi:MULTISPECIES: hypothetical protein [unclassified Myxococcus]|uniref:hypothetical protein n=1 Tax=unclassified Myxococcus TaxID=2648731 RepID=UPI00157ADB98|nr:MULTISPECIES: hypothetical protein [unclassified Myxococcus]NTX34155.1 hypothetical protein [Myxococcus sp. CA033]NTX53131.1 hypothetical protein [Myxococcus sp. CA039A]